MSAHPSDFDQSLVEALRQVVDPELRRSIVDLGMVKHLEVSEQSIQVVIALTSDTCPAADRIRDRTVQELSPLVGERRVEVQLTVMSPTEREKLFRLLQSQRRPNPFTPEAQSAAAKTGRRLTRIIAVTSGKGGVGKSTVTVNLAVGLARHGLRVALVDADVYGFSLPALLGVDPNYQLQRRQGLIVPAPIMGVDLISIGMLLPDKSKPVAWRGPMLHRTINQFLCDVDFGEPDVLLIDMPPGTGDPAISVAQLLPNAEVLVITTPQTLAADVAVRSGLLARQSRQRLIGVVENMSAMVQADGSRLDLFGAGGGEKVARELSAAAGEAVALLGSVPFDTALRESGDVGRPLLLEEPPAAAFTGAGKVLEELCLWLRSQHSGQHSIRQIPQILER